MEPKWNQNGAKMEQNGPKWSQNEAQMEPKRYQRGTWAPLGAPLGPFGAQGGFLHRFWSIFGSILGAKMVSKSVKKQGCFPCHILGPFLVDFELFLERILDTFRQFQPKIEK